jgi:hypothetical protein
VVLFFLAPSIHRSFGEVVDSNETDTIVKDDQTASRQLVHDIDYSLFSARFIFCFGGIIVCMLRTASDRWSVRLISVVMMFVKMVMSCHCVGV